MASVELTVGLTSADVKTALMTQYPAIGLGERGQIPGRWVTLQEWGGIDLLALDCWQPADVVGYEVKVSRSDLRAELLEPAKRMEAVARCTRFYLAVPRGLLTDEELAFEEPDWSLSDFEREPCPGTPTSENEGLRRGYGERVGGPCRNPRHGPDGRYSARRARWLPRGTPKGSLVRLPVPAVLRPQSCRYVDGEPVYSDHDLEQAIHSQGHELVPCPTCRGKGCAALSRVETEAPTLWVPKDVGLVEVYPSGATAIRRHAPKTKNPKTILGEVVEDERRARARRQALADLVRWTSYRPDPRHHA